jgi:hypothetical protein
MAEGMMATSIIFAIMALGGLAMTAVKIVSR